MVFLFMAVFGALAVGYLTASNADLRMSQLYLDSRRAHLAAESGLNLIRRTMPEIDVKGAGDAAEILQAIADGLNEQFQDNLFGGAAATVAGDEVALPAIALSFPEGSSQSRLVVYAISDSEVVVESRGTAGNSAQTIAQSFKATEDTQFLGSFGVATKGRIKMSGRSKIRGANNSQEGSVLTVTYANGYAVKMTGKANISGDLSIANPKGKVKLRGKADIGGDIKIGAAEAEFPEIDVSVFKPYATNEVNRKTKTRGNRYFENILIKAGTNPTFKGNTTIRGVVYIESPNKVRFKGNVKLTGVVVAEQPDGKLKLNKNYISFEGKIKTKDVTALPSDSQFDGLRDMDGAFLLARGYEVKFKGNFGTINGTIAASKMRFSGRAKGTIKGSLINYDDTELKIGGNTRLAINHDGLKTNPPGLVFSKQLVFMGGSYVE